MKKYFALIIAVGLFAALGCGQKPVTTKEFTLGLVQKEIRKGMSQADVAAAIGSPNIVTKDSDGKEAWVYDKFASEASYSHKGNFWTLILLGGSRESGYTRTTQKTLTVIIKFDDNSKVQTLSYHASKF